MDVLIKPEEVVAIVFALQHNKAVVVFAVRGLHPFVAFVARGMVRLAIKRARSGS